MLCLLAAASIVQVLVAIFLPSVAVAFVDVRVFRTWTGLGIREAALQSLLLACVFTFVHPQRSDPAISAQLVFSKLAVVAMIWLCVWLGIRLPVAVIGFWFVLTVVQVLIGFAVLQFLNFSKPLPAASGSTLLRKTALLGITSVAVLSLSIGITYSYPTPRPSYSFEIELNENRSVTIDAFIPDGVEQKQMPAVVIFHGVEGVTPLSRLMVHYPNARAISDKGIATFFVRYFGPSPYDDLMLTKDGALDVDAIEKIRLRDYQGWIDIACQSINKVREQPGVDPDRVAIIGYSLGCYVGTAATSRLCGEGYPCAVVGNFGSIWPEVFVNTSFPPIQFHHGAEDIVIPVENVRAATKRLRESGVHDVELFVYPEQGHVPSGPSSYEIRISTEHFLRKQFSLTSSSGL